MTVAYGVAQQSKVQYVNGVAATHCMLYVTAWYHLQGSVSLLLSCQGRLCLFKQLPHVCHMRRLLPALLICLEHELLLMLAGQAVHLLLQVCGMLRSQQLSVSLMLLL